MGEIKSTLDLVLEKTKDLSLSSQEKQKMAEQNLEKKVRSLLSKYLEELIPLDRLTEEVEQIAGTQKALALQFLKTQLLNQIDFDRDNSSILAALKEIGGIDISSLSLLQQEYLSEKEAAKREITEKSFAELQHKGITGSAVVPNLENNPDWKNFSDRLNKKYRKRVGEMEL
ncbi:MAG: hypothetical protein ACOC6E_02630 [Thermodesulfobacteriota bacterium]